MVNYVSPPPPYPRSISQYSRMPSYAYQIYDTCSINNLMMPPRPGTVMNPPLPTLPSNQHYSDGISTIDAHSSDFGQYFGTFGPLHHHM